MIILAATRGFNSNNNVNTNIYNEVSSPSGKTQSIKKPSRKAPPVSNSTVSNSRISFQVKQRGGNMAQPNIASLRSKIETQPTFKKRQSSRYEH